MESGNGLWNLRLLAVVVGRKGYIIPVLFMVEEVKGLDLGCVCIEALVNSNAEKGTRKARCWLICPICMLNSLSLRFLL